VCGARYFINICFLAFYFEKYKGGINGSNGILVTMTNTASYIFIDAIRSLLIKYAIGTVASLHVKKTDFDFDSNGFWFRLSAHPKVPTQFIHDNMDKPWHFGLLSANPNVTLELIAKFPNAAWSDYFLSGNPNITWGYIISKSKLGCNWDIDKLSKNPAINIEIVKNCPQFQWNILNFTLNPNVTMDVIRKNPQLRMTNFFIYNNPNATWDDMASDPNMVYHTWEVNTNKCVTPAIVKANPQYKWVPDYLARNPNFDMATLVEMYANADDPFRWIEAYQFNPTITVGEILEYGWNWKLTDASARVHWRDMCNSMSKIKWSWDVTISNPTIFDCSVEIDKANAALVILRGWRESMSCPRYKLCRKRLLDEFEALV
jgi:hypothetical protein